MAQETVEKLGAKKEYIKAIDVREIFPDNPDDFAGRVNTEIERGEQFIRQSQVTEELQKKYIDRVDQFVRSVDKENFQSLSDALVSDLQGIYRQMEAGKVFVEKREKAGEKAKEAYERVEVKEKVTEGPETTIEGQTFKLGDPDRLVGAFYATAKVEEGLIKTSQNLFQGFEDAQKKIEEANKQVEGANDSWIPFEGAREWAKSKFTDPPLQKAARGAKARISAQFKAGVGRIEQQKLEVDVQKSKLEEGAGFLLKKTDEALKKNVKDKTTSEAAVSAVDEEFKKVQPAFEMLAGKRQLLEKDFDMKIGQIQRRLTEIEKRLTQIAEERAKKEVEKTKAQEKLETERQKRETAEATIRDKKQKKEPIPRELKEQYESARENEQGLNQHLQEIDRDFARWGNEETSLTEEKTKLEDQQTTFQQDFESKKADQQQALEQAETNKTRLEGNLDQAKKTVEIVAGNVEQLKEQQKNYGELEKEMKGKLGEFTKTNTEIIDALHQQQAYIEHAEVKEYTFFGSCLYSFPMIGKYGIMGVLKGTGWIVDNTLGKYVLKPASDYLDKFGEWTKDIPVLNVIGGFVTASKDLVAGILNMIAKPAETLDGIVNLAIHPSKLKEVGKALIQYDEFEKGKVGYAVGRLVPDVALLFATTGAGAAVKGAGFAGRAASVGKAVFWNAPKAIIKAPWTILKGTANIAMVPLTLFRRAGRVMKGTASGLTAEEAALYARHGEKGLTKVVGEANEAVKAIQTERAEALADLGKKFGKETPQYAAGEMKVIKFYDSWALELQSQAALGQNTLNKIGGKAVHGAVPGEIPRFRPWKRAKVEREASQLEGRVVEGEDVVIKLKQFEHQLGGKTWQGKVNKQQLFANRRKYREAYADYQKTIGSKFVQREALLRQIEKGIGDVDAKVRKAAQLNQDIWQAQRKLGKEFVANTPGIYGARRVSFRLRLFVERSLTNAKMFTEAAWELLKAVPAALKFAKNNLQVIGKTFVQMAKSWEYYPPKMFGIMTNPRLSFAEKYARLVISYPALRVFMEANEKRLDKITPVELEAKLREIAEGELNSKAEKTLVAVHEITGGESEGVQAPVELEAPEEAGEEGSKG